MNIKTKILPALLIAAGMGLATDTLLAESTYGYDSAGTGTPSADARAKVTVNVPVLVMLRVGTAGATVDELTFTASATGMTTDANGNPVSWDGNLPAFSSSATGDTLAAYGWTNSPAGANLTCTVVADAKFTAAEGLTPADVAVSSTGALGHPGTDTSCGGTTTMAKNTLLAASWTYSVNPTALQSAEAGTHSETITYTATAL